MPDTSARRSRIQGKPQTLRLHLDRARIGGEKAAAVVIDNHAELLIASLEKDGNSPRFGMPNNVGDGFLQHAGQRGLDCLIEPNSAVSKPLGVLR